MTDSDEHHSRLPDYVVIGQILRPHGVAGKMRVEPITDDPNRFYLLKRVFLSKDGYGAAVANNRLVSLNKVL